MEQRAARFAVILLYAAGAVGAVWLFVRFLLPWTAPFIAAFLLALLIEPPVSTLSRRGIPRGVAAAFVTLSVLALAVMLTVWLFSWGMEELTEFAGRVPLLMESAGKTLERLGARVRAYISSVPEGAAAYIETALDSAAASLYRLPDALSRRALDLAARAAQNSPGSVLFAVTAGIGTYFLSASFPRTVAFLEAQLPKGLRDRLGGLGRDLKQSFGGWLRAQLILMAVTFAELIAAFMLLRIEKPVALAAVTAVVDALPVFGTGIVLGPWGAYALLLGDAKRGVGLLVSWGVINLVRNCAQAKLLGDQIGLDPAVSLLSVYVGWQIWGVGGMIVFPILFVTLRQLNDKGVLRLWKSI